MLPSPAVDKIKRKYQRYDSRVFNSRNLQYFFDFAQSSEVLGTSFVFFHWDDMEWLCLGDTRAPSHCVKAALKLHTRLLHTRSPFDTFSELTQHFSQTSKMFFFVRKVSKWSKKRWPCRVFSTWLWFSVMRPILHATSPRETGGIRQE